MAGLSGCPPAQPAPRHRPEDAGQPSELDEVPELRACATEANAAVAAPYLEGDAAERIDRPEIRARQVAHVKDEGWRRLCRSAGR